MKRSELEHIIQKKLIKQKHLFDTYRDNPKNMGFFTITCLLSQRVVSEIDKLGMKLCKKDFPYTYIGFEEEE